MREGKMTRSRAGRKTFTSREELKDAIASLKRVLYVLKAKRSTSTEREYAKLDVQDVISFLENRAHHPDA